MPLRQNAKRGFNLFQLSIIEYHGWYGQLQEKNWKAEDNVIGNNLCELHIEGWLWIETSVIDELKPQSPPVGIQSTMSRMFNV